MNAMVMSHLEDNISQCCFPSSGSYILSIPSSFMSSEPLGEEVGINVIDVPFKDVLTVNNSYDLNQL